jgi:hypothetical protein
MAKLDISNKPRQDKKRGLWSQYSRQRYWGPQWQAEINRCLYLFSFIAIFIPASVIEIEHLSESSAIRYEFDFKKAIILSAA